MSLFYTHEHTEFTEDPRGSIEDPQKIHGRSREDPRRIHRGSTEDP